MKKYFLVIAFVLVAVSGYFALRVYEDKQYVKACPNFETIERLWKEGQEKRQGQETVAMALLDQPCAHAIASKYGGKAARFVMGAGYPSEAFGLMPNKQLLDFIVALYGEGDRWFFSRDENLISALQKLGSNTDAPKEEISDLIAFTAASQPRYFNGKIPEGVDKKKYLEFYQVWEGPDSRSYYLENCPEDSCAPPSDIDFCSAKTPILDIKNAYVNDPDGTYGSLQKCNFKSYDRDNIIPLRMYGIIDGNCTSFFQLNAINNFDFRYYHSCKKIISNILSGNNISGEDILIFMINNPKIKYNNINEYILKDNYKFLDNIFKNGGIWRNNIEVEQ